MRERGIVRSVGIEPAGDELAVAVLAGATSIEVTDTADFYDPNVDTVLIIGSETISYSKADPDTDIVTLDTPLANGYAVGEAVYLRANTVTAIVDILTGGSYDNVVVPSSLINQLDGNIYDLEGMGVTVDDNDDDDEEPVLLWIDDQLPDIDGSYINPATLPPPVITDGLPPASAPTGVMTTGFPRDIRVQWTALTSPDAITYRVHATTDPATTPSAATAVGTTAATMFAANLLPDSSPLLPGVTYWWAVEARDDDVLAASMGPVSAWVEGSLDPLKADEIAAGTISGIHLEAVFAVLGEIVTAVSGRRVKISSEGMYFYEQDDSSLLAFPTTGDAFTIAAHMIMESAVARNGITLEGTSRGRKGAAMIMESASSAPLTPPAVEVTWPVAQLASDLMPANKRGLWWDGTNWVFCVAGSGEAPVSTINIVTTAGAAVSTNNLPAGFIADGGVIKISTDYYVLGLNVSTSNWEVRKFNSSFVQTASWVWTPSASSNIKRPALGYNGTDLMIAYCLSSSSGGRIEFKTTAGAAGGTSTITFSSPDKADLAGVHYGTGATATAMGFAATRYIIAPRLASSTIFTYNTSGTIQSNDNWPVAFNAVLCGLGWNGTDFYHLNDPGADSLGLITKYLTTNNWTTESSKWWSGYTQRDGVGTVHETGLSPKASVTMKKRARLKMTATSPLSAAPAADDPDRYRFWVGRGSTAPADSAMWLNGAPGAGVVQNLLDAAVFSGTAVTGKDADFAASTPFEIRTQEGNPLLRATGLPRLRLTKGSTSTGSGTGGTQVGWDSASVDTDGWWSSGTPGFIDPTYSCHALVACDMIWATNGTNLRALWLEESTDGGGSWATVLACQDFAGALNNENTICRFAQMIPLNGANIYRVMRYQNSGASLNFTSARLTITPFGPQ